MSRECDEECGGRRSRVGSGEVGYVGSQERRLIVESHRWKRLWTDPSLQCHFCVGPRTPGGPLSSGRVCETRKERGKVGTGTYRGSSENESWFV